MGAGAAELPHELLLDGEPSGVMELPVEWVRDDAVYFWVHRGQSFRPYTPPAAVFEIFRREFDAAYDEGGLFQLTMHPHVISYRSRIWILEELIRHARQRLVRDACRGGRVGVRACRLANHWPRCAGHLWTRRFVTHLLRARAIRGL